MLKRWDSVYVAGRPKGEWFKWKRDPFLIDAVLLYAQRGHGKRSGFYSDFTFGVWREVDGADELTPVGKAYFGFTDDELKEIDKFVRENTIERFGPVRSVTASKRRKDLVFEVAFEGLNRSPRHKSGIAMRFPRINRIRWDKPCKPKQTGWRRLFALLPDAPLNSSHVICNGKHCDFSPLPAHSEVIRIEPRRRNASISFLISVKFHPADVSLSEPYRAILLKSEQSGEYVMRNFYSSENRLRLRRFLQ